MSGLLIVRFWYRLTQVNLDYGPLNEFDLSICINRRREESSVKTIYWSPMYTGGEAPMYMSVAQWPSG